MSTMHAPARTAGPAEGVALSVLGLAALGLALVLLASGLVTRWGAVMILGSAALVLVSAAHALGSYSTRRRACSAARIPDRSEVAR